MKKIKKKIIIGLSSLFVIVNILAGFHAYKFTHFTNQQSVEKGLKELSFWDKSKALFTGTDMRRPVNYALPEVEYEVFNIQSNKKIECWSLKQKHPKGVVLIFHGYGRQKSFMLEKGMFFYDQKYDVIFTDFMGSGGSEGIQTTIGYKEAIEVYDVYREINQQGYQQMILFGTSLGAVAIMKAVHEYPIEADALILECPFGTMYETVCSRFKLLNAPCFPLAGILMFWGSVENGIWAFNHKPVEYAKSIKDPVLLVYGQKDEKVSFNEIERIYKALKTEKDLMMLNESGHDNYMETSKDEWKRKMRIYLNKVESSEN